MKAFTISILIVLIATLGAFIYFGKSKGVNTKTDPTTINENGVNNVVITNDPDDNNGDIDQKEPINHNNLITLTSPLESGIITSPFSITGEARGQWFFEGSFPVILTNWNGLIIAEGFATSTESWMTTEYIPFEATLEFPEQESGSRGFLILKKDNPSGLPENDDALEIMVFYK
jgi:hypothetical protein